MLSPNRPVLSIVPPPPEPLPAVERVRAYLRLARSYGAEHVHGYGLADDLVDLTVADLSEVLAAADRALSYEADLGRRLAP